MPSRAVLVSFVCMYVASFSSTPCEAHGIPDHVVSYFLHGAPNAFLTSKVLVSLERHRQAPLTILLISLISRRDIEDTSTWMFLGMDLSYSQNISGRNLQVSREPTPTASSATNRLFVPMVSGILLLTDPELCNLVVRTASHITAMDPRLLTASRSRDSDQET